MLKPALQEQVNQAVRAYLKAQDVDAASLNGQATLRLEIPKHAQFGDFAINVSPLSRVLKQSPPQIAAALLPSLSFDGLEPSLAGGFINFKLAQQPLLDALVSTVTADEPAQNEALATVNCLLEFVSANPTGPLHIGHGRWVALGDSLARIMRHCGARVTTEFYLNDAGVQIGNLAMSVWYRIVEQLETGVSFPNPADYAARNEKFPFYPGEYVIEIAQTFLAANPAIKAEITALSVEALQTPDACYLEAIKRFAIERVLGEQQALMSKIGLDFDRIYSEKTLYDTGVIDKTLEKLKATGKTYEADGALWFKTTDYGDDQDRVLRKSSGSYTYLMPDIAYHEDKYTRDSGTGAPHNLFINIWGADHHGYIPRMKAALGALGHDLAQFEVILGQLVNLIVDGEKTRMGKRKTMVTLGELVDEVGVDPVRFWMIAKSADTAIDFDVELATSQTSENPVFYVQYAHARCCSILRNATSEAERDPAAPPFTPLPADDWAAFSSALTPAALAGVFETLETDDAREALRALILRLDAFEDKVVDAATTRSPHLLARYCQDLASDFHKFYTVCRILSPDLAIRKQRLVMVLAVKRVLATALALLGVSAPESM